MSKTTEWAWIPTFTCGIHFDISFDKRIKEINEYGKNKWKELDENEKNHVLQNIVKQIINKDFDFNEISDCKCYSKKHIEEDIPDDPKKFLYTIFADKENKVPYVLFSKYKEKITDISKEDILCFGKIEYDFNKNNIATGLIKTEIIYSPSSHETNKEEENFYNDVLHREIYVCVRDVYHNHSFHGKEHDLLLPPVKASDKKNAVREILKLYENKVLSYQKLLKITHDEEEPENVKQAIDSILTAKGEMIYAQRFIELMDDESFFPFKKIFEHAYDSFEDYNKYVVSRYEVNTSEEIKNISEHGVNTSGEIKHLTNKIVVLTGVLVFFAAFEALKDLGVVIALVIALVVAFIIAIITFVLS